MKRIAEELRIVTLYANQLKIESKDIADKKERLAEGINSLKATYFKSETLEDQLKTSSTLIRRQKDIEIEANEIAKNAARLLEKAAELKTRLLEQAKINNHKGHTFDRENFDLPNAEIVIQIITETISELER